MLKLIRSKWEGVIITCKVTLLCKWFFLEELKVRLYAL